MTEKIELIEGLTEDPEILDDENEGLGDQGMYTELELPEYDDSQFELPDDYEVDAAPRKMSAARTDGLIDHLIKWGLQVDTKDGWRDRGRPYDFRPFVVFCHHTASGATSGNYASERIVTEGRSDLPGPLSQFLLGRNGRVMIIAAGYSNHAGYGGPRAGVPENMGNTYGYGIEAENNGVGEQWTQQQLNAYYRLCAALMAWMGTTDVNRVFGHKEWTSRKIDPAGINMDTFRANVRAALAAGGSVKTVHLSRLKKGKRNKDVLIVKRRLQRRGFFKGEMNNYFGTGLENAYRRWQQHLGYTGSDADGVPGTTSLNKLGLMVKP